MVEVGAMGELLGGGRTMKLIMLKGLPASGKSTYARKLADDGYVRVNKDDLRAMLHNGKWSKNNESQVLRLRNEIIEDSLRSGKSVVVDDTNFAPKHKEQLQTIAKQCNATFETKFFDVSVEECIKRDLARPNSVGEKVIRNMYNQFLKPAPLPSGYNPDLDDVIICDIDGTLAHIDDRNKVVDMWRQQGLKCLPVAKGDF
jgi:predicted kinase